MFLGCGMLLVATILAAIELAPLVGFELLGGASKTNDPYPFMILLFGLMGSMFGAVCALAWRAVKGAERLRVHGIRGQARVLALVPTNLSINDRPLVKVQVSIELPGRAPYNAESRSILDGMLAVRAVPGASVPVRVDPKRPNQFILELD